MIHRDPSISESGVHPILDTATAWFQDGVPSTLVGVSLQELYTAYRIVRTTNAIIRIPFRCGRRIIPLDISMLDPIRTFGDLYKPENCVKGSA